MKNHITEIIPNIVLIQSRSDLLYKIDYSNTFCTFNIYSRMSTNSNKNNLYMKLPIISLHKILNVLKAFSSYRPPEEHCAGRVVPHTNPQIILR